jgi:hypothetical protein
VMHLRYLFRPHFWYIIGNGNNTSAWFDLWHVNGPLCRFISPRAIHAAGFTMHSTVADVCHNGMWSWPQNWSNIFPVLNSMEPPLIASDRRDSIGWKMEDDTHSFSTSIVWNTIRHREPVVDWVKLVWYPQCIPKQAFILWLVLRQRLCTQDKIRGWDIANKKCMNMFCCLLCYANLESHNHLFFECKYSTEIWELVCKKARVHAIKLIWTDVIGQFSNYSSSSTHNIICRLMLAASVYHIWRERNIRYHKNHARPPEVVMAAIVEDVRFRIMGLRFKRKDRVRRLLADWEIWDGEIHDDGG